MAMICVHGTRECDGCMCCQEQKTYCDYCGELITDYCYEINGRNVCQECLDDLFRKEID